MTTGFTDEHVYRRVTFKGCEADCLGRDFSFLLYQRRVCIQRLYRFQFDQRGVGSSDDVFCNHTHIRRASRIFHVAQCQSFMTKPCMVRWSLAPGFYLLSFDLTLVWFFHTLAIHFTYGKMFNRFQTVASLHLKILGTLMGSRVEVPRRQLSLPTQQHPLNLNLTFIFVPDPNLRSSSRTAGCT